MSDKEIDRLNELFERASERLASGKPLKDSYGDGPLSSDHFLLSKAWIYFHERMKTLDDQNRELVKTKDEQIKSLRKQNEALLKEREEIKLKNKEEAYVAEQLSKAKIRDLLLIEKNNETLIKRWDEEKLSLVESNKHLEFKIKELMADLDNLKNLIIQKTRSNKELQEEVRSLKEDRSERIADLNKEKLALNKQHEEEMTSLNRKIELLKKEIDHRDILLKEQAADLMEKSKETKADKHLIEKLESSLEQMTRENKDLSRKIETMKSEQEEVKRIWKNEQSEWRELWDRQRAMWEEKKKDR